MGINLSHAYSVLDALVLREYSTIPDSEITDRLLYVRNPWAQDSFNGTFSNANDFTQDQLL